MWTEGDVGRRRFLWLGCAAGGLLLGAASRGVPGLGWSSRDESLRLRSIDLFEHQQSARAIGIAFLHHHPHEGDARALAHRVAGGLFASESSGPAAHRGWQRALKEQIRRDFAIDMVVNVDGWILSLTEARLCALAALA